MSNSMVLTLVILGLITHVAPVPGQSFECPKPIATPDAWEDLNGNALYDDGELYDPLMTGFGPSEKGWPLVLYAPANPGPLSLGQYYVVEYPPLGGEIPPFEGEEWTQKWFAECSPFLVAAGDSLQLAYSFQVGIVNGELSKRLAQDSTAYWNEETLSIEGSQYAVSPRVITVPAYDPRFPPWASHPYLEVTKLLSLFVESLGPGSRIRTRLVDAGSAGETQTTPTTWGAIKRKYSRQPNLPLQPSPAVGVD